MALETSIVPLNRFRGFVAGSVVLLLALFLLVQNFYILGKKRWKKNKILPILQQESAGPFATTAMGPGGFVIPKVPNWLFIRLDIKGTLLKNILILKSCQKGHIIINTLNIGVLNKFFWKFASMCNFSYFLDPETVSPIHVKSKVCIAPFHVRSKVCIALFHVRSKIDKFAPHMDGSKADFAPHMEGSHADFAPHMERRHCCRDKITAKFAIFAYFHKDLFQTTYFHQLGPLGQVGLIVAKSVCTLCVCSLPMRFFCMVGLVQTVPHLWTGALLISISSETLKTKMCSGV